MRTTWALNEILSKVSLRAGSAWLPPLLGLLPCVIATAAWSHVQDISEQPQEAVIHYSVSTDLTDPISVLQRKLDEGKTKLKFEPRHGYLKSLLDTFEVPVSSQTLVFSKTSSQAPYTSPETPRALYFNDRLFVGWTQKGEAIDVVDIDPKKGPIFYTLKQEAGSPKFERQTTCLRCHNGPKTIGVPGFLVRSVFADKEGTPLGQVLDFVSGHNSPLNQRWGGWYVTGTHEGDSHLGNSFAEDKAHAKQMDIAAAQNVTSLKRRLDTSKYLSPGSDIVALMVLEHAIRMENWITRANYETRLAIAQTEPKYAKGWREQRISIVGEGLLQYLLFRDETVLKGKVKGTSNYADSFQKVGPRDSKGRSLREFDLKSRMFKYPCSYLIYSEGFDALPGEMKEYLWGRLAEILSGADHTARYSKMSQEDRKAVFEILLDTKPEFASWVKSHPL